MPQTPALVNGEIYHVFNKSIAGYQIFNDQDEYHRMVNAIRYYKMKDLPCPLSDFLRLNKVHEMGFEKYFDKVMKGGSCLIDLLAFCLMPTHIHLILRQVEDDGISVYMSNILNSYARYFNRSHRRKGPLWVGRFGRRHVVTDEDFLHLSRYVHLNPVTACLVGKPEGWEYSSYKEYINLVNQNLSICDMHDVIELNPEIYKKFVNEQIDAQRELAQIKHLVLE